MKQHILVASVGLAAAALAGPTVPPPETALRGLDPIDLIAGRETPGSPQRSVVRGRYRYQFANDANRRRFEGGPERYAIQMGGACARMGPLSGQGSPERFLVHDGRIYVFASDICRTAFRTAPNRFLDPAERPVSVTTTDREQGRTLLARALEGLGGAPALERVHSLQTKVRIIYRSGGESQEGDLILTMGFPGRFRTEERWGKWASVAAADGNGGFRQEAETAWPMERGEQDYFLRAQQRHPLALLQSREEPDFLGASGGTDRVNGEEVALLQVSRRGVLTTLALDERGRIVQTRYRGRAFGVVGDVVVTYSDFRQVGSLILPYGTETRLDGRRVLSPTHRVDAITLNPKLTADHFRLVGK